MAPTKPHRSPTRSELRQSRLRLHCTYISTTLPGSPPRGVFTTTPPGSPPVRVFTTTPPGSPPDRITTTTPPDSPPQQPRPITTATPPGSPPDAQLDQPPPAPAANATPPTPPASPPPRPPQPRRFGLPRRVRRLLEQRVLYPPLPPPSRPLPPLSLPRRREPYKPAPVEPTETFFECIARGGRWTGWPLTRKQAQREAKEAREREVQEQRKERFMQRVRDGVEQRRVEMEEERRQREQERGQVEAPAPVEEQQERREEGEARLPDDLGEPYELRIPPPDYVCPWATRRAELARKKTVHFDDYMDLDSDDDYDDSMVSSDDSSDVDMHDADLGVPAPAVPVPNFADGDEDEVQGRLPGYRGVDLALPEYRTQRPWARLERSPSPEIPSSDSDVEAAHLVAWGIPVRKFAFQSWDRVRVEARETLVAAYLPRLALRHTTGQTVVQLHLTDGAELRIAFGILSAPGNLHNHLRLSKDGDIDAGERALIAQRWDRTLKIFDTWGGPLGVKRLYTSLRLMIRQVPESIDAATAFVLACRANDAGGAYKCLLTYGQVMFSDAGNRNMAFAQELRAMPSDCAARTNPDSWNQLLPKPYKLAVQLAGERWDPVRDLQGYAQGFLTIALRLVYGFSGETFFRPAFATPNTDGCDDVPAVASDKKLTRRIREVTGRPLPTARNEQGTYRVPPPPPNELHMDAMARRPRCLPRARLKAPEDWGSAWGCSPSSSYPFAYPAKRN